MATVCTFGYRGYDIELLENGDYIVNVGRDEILVPTVTEAHEVIDDYLGEEV